MGHGRVWATDRTRPKILRWDGGWVLDFVTASSRELILASFPLKLLLPGPGPAGWGGGSGAGREPIVERPALVGTRAVWTVISS